MRKNYSLVTNFLKVKSKKKKSHLLLLHKLLKILIKFNYHFHTEALLFAIFNIGHAGKILIIKQFTGIYEKSLLFTSLLIYTKTFSSAS